MTDVNFRNILATFFRIWTLNVTLDLNHCYFLLIMISSEHIYDIKACNFYCLVQYQHFSHRHSNIYRQMFLSLFLPPSNTFVIHQWTTFHTTVRLSAKTSWTSGEGIVMAEPHSALLCHDKDRSRDSLLNWKWLTNEQKKRKESIPNSATFGESEVPYLDIILFHGK